MKRSELKALVKEVIKEHSSLKEFDIENNTIEEDGKNKKWIYGVLGYVLGTAKSAIDGGVRKDLMSLDKDPQIRKAKKEFEIATKKFAKVLEQYEGSTPKEKADSFMKIINRPLSTKE